MRAGAAPGIRPVGMWLSSGRHETAGWRTDVWLERLPRRNMGDPGSGQVDRRSNGHRRMVRMLSARVHSGP